MSQMHTTIPADTRFIVEVYDSMNSNNKLNEMHIKVTKILYTNNDKKRNIIYKKVKNVQTDTSSCGIYALDYAITLAIVKKPESINYHINNNTNDEEDEVIFLRQHLLKIIEIRDILLVPEI